MHTERIIYLSAADLVDHFKNLGAPLPFSRSSLEKDRLTCCLGGIPYRRIGGLCVYHPQGILDWLAGLPIVQPQRHHALPASGRRGKPTKQESVEASRCGMTVKELRAQSNFVLSGGAK